MIPILETPLGQLYQSDGIRMMRTLEPECVDLAFADPPFNLGKKYTSKIDDSKADHEYLDWCRSWIDEMTRVLKPGGRRVIQRRFPCPFRYLACDLVWRPKRALRRRTHFN
jgi:DNA methylase